MIRADVSSYYFSVQAVVRLRLRLAYTLANGHAKQDQTDCALPASIMA